MSSDNPDENTDMRVDKGRAAQLLASYMEVKTRMAKVNVPARNVRLVLVSKLKPASDILALHQHEALQEAPPEHFGENYFQELQQKASILPQSIKWHFIGALQTKKCKPLAENVSNLWCVSSVDSAKKADQLEKGRELLCARESDAARWDTLRVHVQINTSGEADKSGVEPGDEAIQLCKHIRASCPHLQLAGIMTIGAIARSRATTAETENEDFTRLREARDQICQALDIKVDDLELSMGMSSDFEGAINQSSDEVRIGSTIFGERPPKAEAQV